MTYSGWKITEILARHFDHGRYKVIEDFDTDEFLVLFDGRFIGELRRQDVEACGTQELSSIDIVNLVIQVVDARSTREQSKQEPAKVMSENSKLEHALRTLNGLDAHEDRRGRWVHFYATADDKARRRPAVTLLVEDGRVQVASSMCLPTDGWGKHAFAVQRALEFLRLSGMTDARKAGE